MMHNGQHSQGGATNSVPSSQIGTGQLITAHMLFDPKQLLKKSIVVVDVIVVVEDVVVIVDFVFINTTLTAPNHD